MTRPKEDGFSITHSEPVRQPHYIDREAVAAHFQDLWDRCACSTAPFNARQWADETLAFLSAPAPMEAVAWRERVADAIVDFYACDGWDAAEIYGLTDAIFQAVAMIAPVTSSPPHEQNDVPACSSTEREIQDAMDALRPLGWASEDSLLQGALRALADVALQKEREG